MYVECTSVRVFLDCNQWNYLVEPDDSNGLGLDEWDLRAAVSEGRIAVVGSVDLLQELISAVTANDAKSRRMCRLFFDLVGKRIVMQLSDRHIAEGAASGLLPDNSVYLNRDTRRALQKQALRRRNAIDIANELYDDKKCYRVEQTAMRDEVLERLANASNDDEKLTISTDWYRNELDLDREMRDVVLGGMFRGASGLTIANGTGFEQFPSAWTFLAASLAADVFRLAYNRKILPSDLADLHHAATGAYIDVLVTDDKRFRELLALLPAIAVPLVVDSPTFREMLTAGTGHVRIR